MTRVLFIVLQRATIAKDNYRPDIERLLDARTRDWHSNTRVDSHDAVNFAKTFRGPNQCLLVGTIARPLQPDESDM